MAGESFMTREKLGVDIYSMYICLVAISWVPIRSKHAHRISGSRIPKVCIDLKGRERGGNEYIPVSAG